MPTETLPPERQAQWSALLDTIIPADATRGLPGAGSLGIEAAVCAALDAGTRDRLEALDGFAADPPERRQERLTAFDAEAPGVLAGVLYHAMQAYYSDARVVTGLGVETHPPFPVGFTLEAGDLSGLERVRERGRRYREP